MTDVEYAEAIRLAAAELCRLMNRAAFIGLHVKVEIQACCSIGMVLCDFRPVVTISRKTVL